MAFAAPGDSGPAVDVLDLPPLPDPALAPGEIDLQELLAAAAAGEDLVTGVAKREQTLGNVASAVTVISGDRLRRMGARTVGDAIATAAGIHLVDDRMSTRVGIRGLQPAGDFNTRILVIIDGTTVTESWSHQSGVGYDLPVSIDEVERIEVIRGPVSSIYGTNAFFGIINIITRDATALGRVWGRATAGQISGGSAAAGFALGTVDKQLRGSFSATMRRGEEVRYDAAGEAARDREMDGGEQAQFSLTGTYRGTFAQLRGFRYDRTIPFAPYESDFDDPYQQTNQELLADIGHAMELRGVQLSGRLFGTLYRFDDRATSTPTPEDPEDEEALPLITIGTTRTIGAELRGRYQVHELVGATAGFEATYNDTTSAYQDEGAAEYPAGDMSFALAGFYVEADAAPKPWLGLTAGLRIDKHRELSSDKDFNELTREVGVSPRLAVFLSRAERYGVKLLYATGFRYPNTYEAKFEDNRDFVGNNLKPERISSAEMVWWARPTATTWLRASAFRWRAVDVIKQNEERFWVDKDGKVVRPVEGDDDLGPPGTLKESRLQFANDDAYTSLGLELEASYRDRRGWLAFAGASLVRARIETTEESMNGGDDEKTEKRPPGSPRWTASFGVSSPKLGGLLHLSSELTLIGARRPLDCPAACSDMPSSLEFFAGWNAAIYLPSLRGFDVTLGARNLLGRRQEVLAAEDFNRDGQPAGFVPGEGRELYVRVGHAL